MNSGIYRITSLIDGKTYIGSSIKINKRFYAHRDLLKRQKHHNIYLQRIYNKYGMDNLYFEIVYLTKNTLNWEQYFIDKLQPEINIAKDSFAPMTGRQHLESTKTEMSEKRMGSQNGMFGKTHTEKAKKIMSEKIKENFKHWSPEKIAAWKEKITPKVGYWKGKHISEESKKKISEQWKIKGRTFKCLETGNLYNTQLSAAKALRIRQGHINEVLNKKRSHAGGYHFEYVK